MTEVPNVSDKVPLNAESQPLQGQYTTTQLRETVLSDDQKDATLVAAASTAGPSPQQEHPLSQAEAIVPELTLVPPPAQVTEVPAPHPREVEPNTWRFGY